MATEGFNSEPRTYAAKGGAQFTTTGRGWYPTYGTHMTWVDDSPRGVDVIGRVEVSIHGTYSYGGHEDRAARVEIRHDLNSDHQFATRAWCSAQRWTDRGRDDMPPKGREAIAAAVLADFVAEVVGALPGGWDDLARMAWDHECDWKAKSERDQATRHLEDAARWEARRGQYLPIAGKVTR